MDDREFDSFLRAKLAPLEERALGDSIAPQVIERLAAAKTRGNDYRRWILGIALVLGILVCIPSLSAIELEALGSFGAWFGQVPLPQSELDWGGVRSNLTNSAFLVFWLLAIMPFTLLLLED